MTRQEFKKLAREEAEKYAESQLGHANPLMKVACAIDYRAGASFGFDQGVEEVLEMLRDEEQYVEFGSTSNDIADWIEAKLAAWEGETK